MFEKLFRRDNVKKIIVSNPDIGDTIFDKIFIAKGELGTIDSNPFGRLINKQKDQDNIK